MQIGFDVGATKIESVVLKDNGEETNRSRKMVGQLETGACLETESLYLDITNTKGMPRHSH
jgi:predicted NBD/HSP70 family sugar kinase